MAYQSVEWAREGNCYQWVAAGGKNLWISDDRDELNLARVRCEGCVVMDECRRYLGSLGQYRDSRVGGAYGVYAGKFVGVTVEVDQVA